MARDQETYLSWEFQTRPWPDAAGSFYHQEAVTWMEGGKPAWRVRLPERMRRYQAGLGEAEFRALHAHPRAASRYLGILCGLLYLDDAVVIGDPSGLLVLGRRDGSVLLDYADPAREQGEHLFFDRGSYTIQASGGRAWSGDTRKAAFVAKCGDRLVYFNGRTMAVFGTDPWKLRQAVRYEAAVQRRSSSPARYGAEFHLDGMGVRLEGTVYLRK